MLIVEKELFFSNRERSRHHRITCKYCGSPALDPAPKSKVKDDILEQNANLLLNQTNTIAKCIRKKY